MIATGRSRRTETCGRRATAGRYMSRQAGRSVRPDCQNSQCLSRVGCRKRTNPRSVSLETMPITSRVPFFTHAVMSNCPIINLASRRLSISRSREGSEPGSSPRQARRPRGKPWRPRPSRARDSPRQHTSGTRRFAPAERPRGRARGTRRGP
jgi:hypothetical protein